MDPLAFPVCSKILSKISSGTPTYGFIPILEMFAENDFMFWMQLSKRVYPIVVTEGLRNTYEKSCHGSNLVFHLSKTNSPLQLLCDVLLPFDNLAGREGFEPSVDRSPQRFSRPSHSTTLAPPQKGVTCQVFKCHVRLMAARL